MRLRLFTASTMPLALALARAELGDEALILSTRRTRDGIEVTAALDAAAELPAPSASQAMSMHRIPAAIEDRVAGASDTLCDRLAATLLFTTLALGGDDPPLLMAGPPGAGKTLTVARLATRLVLAGVRPTVITIDDRRAGAAEQLAAFTRLLGLELIAVGAAGLPRALARRHPHAPALVDCAGCDLFDPGERARLADLAACVNGTLAAVLPAGLDSSESADSAACLREAGASALIATRLDLARRLGGIVAAAGAPEDGGGGLPLAEAGIGPGAADGLVPMTPGLLASRLLAGRCAEKRGTSP